MRVVRDCTCCSAPTPVGANTRIVDTFVNMATSMNAESVTFTCLGLHSSSSEMLERRLERPILYFAVVDDPHVKTLSRRRRRRRRRSRAMVMKRGVRRGRRPIHLRGRVVPA